MSGNNIITVENLHKRFGSLHVLKGVTEHIGKGEVVPSSARRAEENPPSCDA